MSDIPLSKPDHLQPATAGRSWAQRPAGLTALAVGVMSFIVVAVTQHAVWSTPDWRVSVPGVVLAAIAAIASLVRRESGAYPLWLLGLGLAGAATVLGWFLMFAIVITATVIVMAILHSIM